MSLLSPLDEGQKGLGPPYQDRAQGTFESDGGEVVKNNYKKLIRKLDEWENFGTEMNRLTSLNIGVISGGPDYTDEHREQELLRVGCYKLVDSMIKNGARLSYLKQILDTHGLNKHGGRELVEEEMREREFQKECERERRERYGK